MTFLTFNPFYLRLYPTNVVLITITWLLTFLAACNLTESGIHNTNTPTRGGSFISIELVDQKAITHRRNIQKQIQDWPPIAIQDADKPLIVKGKGYFSLTFQNELNYDLIEDALTDMLVLITEDEAGNPLPLQKATVSYRTDLFYQDIQSGVTTLADLLSLNLKEQLELWKPANNLIAARTAKVVKFQVLPSNNHGTTPLVFYIQLRPQADPSKVIQWQIQYYFS